MIIQARKGKLLLYFFTGLFFAAVLLFVMIEGKILFDDRNRLLPVRIIPISFLILVGLVIMFQCLRTFRHRKAVLILKDGVITDYNYLFKFPRKIDVSEIRSIEFYSGYRGIHSYKFVLKKKTIYLTCMYCKNSTLQEFIQAVEQEMELLTKD